jgi:hypothetical protein
VRVSQVSLTSTILSFDKNTEACFCYGYEYGVLS